MAPRAKCRRVLRRNLTLKSHFPDHLLNRARISAQSQLAGAVGQLNSVSEILGKMAPRAKCRRVLRRKLTLKSHFPDQDRKRALKSEHSQLAGGVGHVKSVTEVIGRRAPRAKCRRDLSRKVSPTSHFPDHLLNRARISAQSQLAGAVGQLNSVSEILGKMAPRAKCRRVLRRKLTLKSHFPDHLLKRARISAQSQ